MESCETCKESLKSKKKKNKSQNPKTIRQAIPPIGIVARGYPE